MQMSPRLIGAALLILGLSAPAMCQPIVPPPADVDIGPNITPAGVALAIAAGMTFRAGTLNVPINFAVVPSKSGTRVSVLTGFSLRRR